MKMSVQITWIGHAAFRLDADGLVVYIDPWKLKHPENDADLIFVSHDHYDHGSPEAVQKVRNETTVILAPGDAAGKIPDARDIQAGQSLEFPHLTVLPVPAYNIDKTFHPRVNGWCGAIFELGGKRIYYSGDTDRIPEMKELGDIDLALLPVGGTYTLTAGEAAEACRDIQPRSALPYHWGDIVGDIHDAEEFESQAPCEVFRLDPGGTITI